MTDNFSNVIPLKENFSTYSQRISSASFSSGGGGDNVDGMEGRVSKLETHMDYVRKDLGDIKKSLSILPELATKTDLETWRWQWLATGIGIVTLVVAGVVGGLALINHYAAAGPPSAPSAPNIIYVSPPDPPSGRVFSQHISRH